MLCYPLLSFPFLPYLLYSILPYPTFPIISYAILSYLIYPTSRHVTSRHVTSRHVTSRHVTSRHVLSCLVLSCHQKVNFNFLSNSNCLLKLDRIIIIGGMLSNSTNFGPVREFWLFSTIVSAVSYKAVLYYRTLIVQRPSNIHYHMCTGFKGQLQRFHKLISNYRIWPSEHGFEVIFEKSLFVFEISAFKVRNKRGIHSRFHSFSENNNRETFVYDVTSDQSSVISRERSDLRDCKASGNC